MMIEYQRALYNLNSPRMITSDRGRTWALFVSADDNFLFFLRDGGGFGGGGQGRIVDVYSTTTWSRVHSWTFAFGDGYHLRNVKILPNLAVDKPVHLAISGGREYYGTVITSSGGLQFQVTTIEHSSSGQRTWISGDGRHMVYLSKDNGKLHFWDLTNPTYEPLQTVQLPDVETSAPVTFTFNGKPVASKQAIPKQIIYCRFSPGNEVATVIVANDKSVVVLAFLTFNLQLVYKRTQPFGICPAHQVLQARIGAARGVSLVGLAPVAVEKGRARGLIVTFTVLTGVYEDIRAVETHFDTAEATLKSIGRNSPILRILHQWTMSPDAVARQLGDTRPLTQDEKAHQLKLFNSIFLKDRFADHTPTTVMIQNRVFHLMTITYPWDPKSKVYVFAVRMKYNYSIVAMAVAKQVTAEPYLIRVLFVSETLYGADQDVVEIIQNGPHYVLKVQGKSDGAYSRRLLPLRRITIIGHHFLPNDAPYDIFIVKESTGTTMPSGGIVSPNLSLVFIANIAAYFPPHYMWSGGILAYGHRRRGSYVMPKFKVWLDYAHRSRRNEPFFGGGELMDEIGSSENCNMVFNDPIYDDKYPLFPSGFATAAVLDILSNQTLFVDEFMKRYHKSDALILSNSQAISCSLPAVCRARPLGLLSFLRHIALFNVKLAENTPVVVSNRAHERNDKFRNRYPRNKFLAIFWQLFSFFGDIYAPSLRKNIQKANTTTITIPLDGFCSYDHHIYGLPVVSYENEAVQHFSNMAERAYYNEVVTGETADPVFSRVMTPSRPKGSIRTSPFTCLVEEVFRIDDQELQFSIIKVVWLEKLVYLKLETFGRYVFLTRIVFPSLVNWILLFALSILTSKGGTSTAILVLGGIQAFVCTYLIAQKFRQAQWATRLFFRSFFNFMDVIAITLSITNAVLVLTGHTPPRPFIAYATTIVWVDVISSPRVYETAGILMILLTEMMKGVMPFLILLALFIVGFTFIPFLLLKDESSSPFTHYGRSLGEMITFMSNDFTSLDPFNDRLVSIQVLRAVFTILISILFLNSLIALLNLRVEAADKKSRILWIRQMAALLVEIERGILTAHERKNRRWFPRWFTYNIREDEKNQWQAYIDKHPIELGYHGPDNNPNLTAAASRTDNNPRSTVAPPQTQEATTSNASPPDPLPTAKPTSQTQPVESVPGPVTVQVPVSVSLITPDSVAGKMSALSMQTTLSTSSTTSTVTQPTANPKHPSQPSGPPTKLPIPSETSTTPPTPTPTSRTPAGFTMKPQLSTSVGITSTSQATSTEVASQKSGEGNAEEKIVSQKCQICELVGTKLCTGCRSTRYCSAEHQRQDWAAHKKLCAGKAREGRRLT